MPETLGKLSGKPMTGRFIVKCFDENGKWSGDSNPIGICDSDHRIERYIGEYCGKLRNKFEVTHTYSESSSCTAGIDILIRFEGINYGPK